MLSLKSIWAKRLFFATILVVGIVLRLYKWNSYSLWYDEVAWWMYPPNHNNLLNWLQDTVWMAKPPLFRFLLYFWSFFSQDEFILRLLPFICAILSIIIAFKVGKALFDEKIGLMLSFFLSISPFHIYYSQELTHYSLTMLLALCSIYYLVQSLKINKIYSWTMFSLFSSLALYANYICIFLLISENIFFFFSYKEHRNLLKRWLSSQLAILLLYSPWIVMYARQFHILSLDNEYFHWIPKGSLTHIFYLFRTFNIGYNASPIIHFFALLLFFPLLFIGILIGLQKEKWKIKLLLIWLFAPIILSLLLSKVYHSLTYRNFIFTLPAYYLIIAASIVKLKRYLYIPVLLSVALCSLSLFNYYNNSFPYPEALYRPGVHAKKDNRAATKYISTNLKRGDLVIHSCISTAFPYIYYRFIAGYIDISTVNYLMKEFYNFPIDKTRNYKLNQGETCLLVKSTNELTKFVKYDNTRIWFVFSAWEPQDLAANPSMKENKIKNWMDDNFEIIDYKKFTGIEVYLYEI